MTSRYILTSARRDFSDVRVVWCFVTFPKSDASEHVAKLKNSNAVAEYFLIH